MANPSVAAGTGNEVNGAAGVVTPAELVAQVAAITGTYAAGNVTSTETTAVRQSVAQTAKQYGGAPVVSEVYSVSQGMRTAYAGVESDAPAITRI